MKKIISIILSIMMSSLLYAGSLSVDDKHIVPNETIIETFKRENIPSGIYISPMGDKSNWKLEVKSKEEYLAWAMIFSMNLYSSSKTFSQSQLLPEIQRVLNEGGDSETAKELLKAGLKEVNSLTYDVFWSSKDENSGAVLMRYQYSAAFETAVPFRIIDGKKIEFLYGDINIKIPEIQRFWLYPLYTFPN